MTPALIDDDPRCRTVAVVLEKTGSTLAEPPAPPYAPRESSSKIEPSRGATPAPNRQIVLIAGGILFALFCALFLIGPGTSGRKINEVPFPEPVSIGPDTSSAGSTPIVAVSHRDAEKSVLMLRSPEGSGSAFIAIVDGTAYVYTNVHCITSTEVSFTDFEGNRVRVEGGPELVVGSDEGGLEAHDLVRFRLAKTPRHALVLAPRSQIESGSNVYALGDSSGAGVLRSLPGKILGIGPSKVEVDCEFIQGNSGGPIVTSDGQVVAIASYMTSDHSIWAEGTKHVVRRFGWIPGRAYEWRRASLIDLIGEMELVTGSERTARFLAAVSLMELSPKGFKWPAELSVEGDYTLAAIMEECEEHPLMKRLLEITNAIQKLAGNGDDNREIYRYYSDYLETCSSFANDQLGRREAVQSSYWRTRAMQGAVEQEDLIESFNQKVILFKRRPRLGTSLAEL